MTHTVIDGCAQGLKCFFFRWPELEWPHCVGLSGFAYAIGVSLYYQILYAANMMIRPGEPISEKADKNLTLPCLQPCRLEGYTFVDNPMDDFISQGMEADEEGRILIIRYRVSIIYCCTIHW